jgi:hypothetical protein
MEDSQKFTPIYGGVALGRLIAESRRAQLSKFDGAHALQQNVFLPQNAPPPPRVGHTFTTARACVVASVPVGGVFDFPSFISYNPPAS